MTTTMPPRILLGSTNPAKIDRLRDCLEGWAFDFITVDNLPPHEPPEETGSTHLEIAEAKAVDWARISGGLAIASDGGIDIPALGPNWDSLLTRRAAGQDATDEDRVQHLPELMEHLESNSDREATWKEALVIALPPGIVQTWEVTGPTGVIQREPSAKRIEGFWLASLWYFPDMRKTYTELTTSELAQVGDPWLNLKSQVQAWLADGRYEGLGTLSF
ncbi:MAG: hypothetical protein F4X20_05135 [Dehalococcoidia bacterium]|nr:hypothetical protein [Dehalococcoidia bacterium]